MPEWLSAEWVGSVADSYGMLPPVGEGRGSVSLAFQVAPRKEVSVYWTYEDGEVVAGGVGPKADAEVALTVGAGDAADLLSGRVEPSVAFMRGRLKASGEGSLLLAFLASTTSSGFEAWREQVAGLAPIPA